MFEDFAFKNDIICVNIYTYIYICVLNEYVQGGFHKITLKQLNMLYIFSWTEQRSQHYDFTAVGVGL